MSKPDVSFSQVGQPTNETALNTETCHHALGNPPVHGELMSEGAESDDNDGDSSNLFNLAESILEECKEVAPLSDLDTAIYLFREAIARRPAPHPYRSYSLKGLAEALVVRFSQTNHEQELREIILLCGEIFTQWHDGLDRTTKIGSQSKLDYTIAEDDNMLAAGWDDSEASQLMELASVTLAKFNQSTQLSSLDTAVTLHREALHLRPFPHPTRLASLRGLAATLYTRFRRTDDIQDLDEAISLLREAVRTCPLNESHPSLLNHLTATLAARFNKTSQLSDLHEAFSQSLDILQDGNANNGEKTDGGYGDDDEEADGLFSFANNLFGKFNQSGQIADLETAIALFREVIVLRPDSHPLRSGALNNLALALNTRFDQLGRREDLDEALSLHRDALELSPVPHPERSMSLINLAKALCTRFDQSGQRGDLEEAISLHRDALELCPAPHAHRSRSLLGLANALNTRFGQSGQREDLEEAILLHREALELCPAPHPDRSMSLLNLASVLQTRFSLLGKREDLDEAILLLRDALQLFPTTHPNRCLSLHNLATVLKTRFNQSGQHKDLDEAISLYHEALELFPAYHPHRSMVLNNLANALDTRFTKSGQLEDIDQAISLHRNALKLRTAPHPGRSMSLNNLAIVLNTRFEQSGQREDLEEMISMHRDALELCPVPHPSRSMSLNNLALALNIRFHQSGQRQDLDEAISLLYESLDALVTGHPQTCATSANLGETLMDAYSHTHQTEYLDKAMAAFRVAMKCDAAPASERFHAAKSWARHADSNHDSALEAYRAAIPRLAMLGLDLQSRHQALTSGSDGLARDAAACAIRSGHYETAVELLEAGRAVFWSQALQLRTPMTDLHDVAPALEEELRRISHSLEQGSFRDMSRNLSDTPQRVVSLEQEASHFRRLDEEWQATLEQVRQLSGFQDFLRPSRFSVLRGATTNGPVVILNTSKSGSDALIMTSSSVEHVCLSDLSFQVIQTLVKLIQQATASNGRYPLLSEADHTQIQGLAQRMPDFPNNDIRHLGKASNFQIQPEHIFRFVLAVLWMWLVKPVICSLNLEKSDAPPNLRWCPAGPFAFLPIHAAGFYHTKTSETVFDYVVSSYTPTISVLLTAMPPPTNSFEMVVVIQPQTLPCTIQELQKIVTHVPDTSLVMLGIPGAPASVEKVVSHLSTVSIAHFACHGQQNARKPLDSALILEDGSLKVSRILQQSMPNASLAFLCACETAMGDKDLPDEAIHLGATLLFSGFRGVVATMWSISDADGPKITDAFYENLFQENSSTTILTSQPDTTQAARALCLAVVKLRSENASFARWVPFIHLGR